MSCAYIYFGRKKENDKHSKWKIVMSYLYHMIYTHSKSKLSTAFVGLAMCCPPLPSMHILFITIASSEQYCERTKVNQESMATSITHKMHSTQHLCFKLLFYRGELSQELLLQNSYYEWVRSLSSFHADYPCFYFGCFSPQLCFLNEHNQTPTFCLHAALFFLMFSLWHHARRQQATAASMPDRMNREKKNAQLETGWMNCSFYIC